MTEVLPALRNHRPITPCLNQASQIEDMQAAIEQEREKLQQQRAEERVRWQEQRTQERGQWQAECSALEARLALLEQASPATAPGPAAAGAELLGALKRQQGVHHHAAGSGGSAAGQLALSRGIALDSTGGTVLTFTTKTHPFIVLCLAPCEGRVFCGSCDKSVHVWDTHTHVHLASMERHTGWVLAVCTDGQQVFSGGEDGMICSWGGASFSSTDAMGDEPMGHEGGVHSLVIAAGKLFSGGADSVVRCWDLKAHTALATLQGHSACVCSLATDGERLFSGSDDNTIRVWDCATHAHEGTLRGHCDCIHSLQVAAGKLFSGSEDCTVRVWDIRSLELIGVLEHQDCVYAIAASLHQLFTGSGDGSIATWDLSTLERVGLLAKAHEDAVKALSVSSEGKLLSASDDATVCAWDVPSASSGDGGGVSQALSVTLASPPRRSRLLQDLGLDDSELEGADGSLSPSPEPAELLNTSVQSDNPLFRSSGTASPELM